MICKLAFWSAIFAIAIVIQQKNIFEVLLGQRLQTKVINFAIPKIIPKRRVIYGSLRDSSGLLLTIRGRLIPLTNYLSFSVVKFCLKQIIAKEIGHKTTKYNIRKSSDIVSLFLLKYN